MAYRVKLSKSLGKDVRRLLTGQIGRAVGHLSGAIDEGGSSIHATRKCLKRCRSIVRLIEPALSNKQFRTYDHAFRDIARLLSHDRDREVMQETLVQLATKADTAENRDAIAAAATELDGESINGFAHSAARDNIECAIGRLHETEQAIHATAFEKADIATVAEGFADTYAAGKKALKNAYRLQDDEAFHAFRKALQHHWRHCQLLSPIWPEMMVVRINAAREQSQLIGHDHDLSLITTHFGPDGPSKLNRDVRSRICNQAKAEQARLRAEAKPLAERLYAIHSADLERMVLRLWPAAKNLAKHQRRMGTAEHAPAEQTAQPSAQLLALKFPVRD